MLPGPDSQGRASVPHAAQLERFFLSPWAQSSATLLLLRCVWLSRSPVLSSPPTLPGSLPTAFCVTLCQVHKLLIVVELLLGEIPDRLQFRQPSLKRSLMPYFLLTQGKAGPLPERAAPRHCVPSGVRHVQHLTHSSPHRSCQDRKPSQVQPGPGSVWGEVPSRWDLHPHHPTAAQRHQDRCGSCLRIYLPG